MKINKDKKYLAQPCAHVPEYDFGRVAIILKREMLRLGDRAVGLAANQISLNYRAFAMKHEGKIIVFINPTITDKWGDEIILKEKCLSLKKEFKVKRYMYIRVKDDYQTQGMTMALTNFSAQVFQHEMDHINGITIETRSQK